MGKQPQKKKTDEVKVKTNDQTVPALPKLADNSRALLIFALGLAFLLGMGAQFIADHGLPKINITWGQTDDGGGGEVDDASIGAWCKKNRPKLETDYKAAGQALWDTSARLSSGVLFGAIDAQADTIARVQPVVSDPAAWREFIDRLGVRIGNVPAAELADGYRDAARSFGINGAVRALEEAVTGGSVDETGAVEIAPENSGGGGALGDDRQDQGESQPDGGGEDRGAVSEDEEAAGGPGGEPAPAETSCPGGQCPAPVRRPSQTYSPFNWWNPGSWYGW